MSVGASPGRDCRERLEEDLEIEREGPVLYVEAIDPEGVFGVELAPAEICHSPVRPPRTSCRGRRKTSFAAQPVQLGEVAVYEAHIAADHVPKLGKFVETVRA